MSNIGLGFLDKTLVGPIGALGLFIVLCLYYLWSGALSPEPLPRFFESAAQVQGMLLLFVLVVPFIWWAMVFARRRSLELAREIDHQFPGVSLTSQVLTVPLSWLGAGLGLGLLYAVFFNIPDSMVNIGEANRLEVSIIVGQILVWLAVGALLAFRLRVGLCFHRVAKEVPMDLFEHSPLKPFARLGLVDVVVVAGGMIISTVQSLDFSFRPDNYSKALIVVVPAVVYMMVYPMYPLHHRLQAAKNEQLALINDAVRTASKAMESSSMAQLELLLQRRARIRETPTWPVDLAIVQRFVFYLVVPPLAWVGAALVEMALTNFVD